MLKTVILSSALFVILGCTDAQQSYSSNPTRVANNENKETLPENEESPPEDQDSAVADETESVTEVVSETPKAVSVRNSAGSGGSSGLVEVPFTDSTGLASSYKINAPADVGQKIYGLHIHLHGDGGGGYVDFPNKELRNNLIGVTIKAPNQTLQWGRAAGRPHARFVNELIQNELLKKYNIDMDKIFFSTVSGGSYFFMGSFLPEFGQVYNSAAFVMCGGEAPRVAFTDPKVLGKFRVHVEVTAGERADILASIQAMTTAYKTAMDTAGIAAAEQVKIQTQNIQGAGAHCVFDGVSYTSGIQQAIDTKFKAVLPL